MLIAGGTGSGKTFLVSYMLQHLSDLYDKIPKKIYVCYSRDQNLYDSFSELTSVPIEFIQGLPQNLVTEPGSLLIIDDLQSESALISHWFTKSSHHYNTNVIFITQNLFLKHPEFRTISLNSHYLIIFKNPRDMSQIANLAKQIKPGHAKFLVDSYRDATYNPHCYLVIDLKQSTPEHLRFRSNIDPTKGYYYVDKSEYSAFENSFDTKSSNQQHGYLR